MNKNDILKKTEVFVREKLSGEGTGHDWWHVARVRSTALELGRQEKADLFIVELGALLHDIADFKFHNNDETVGPRVAQEWLSQVGADAKTIEAVIHIVEEISFKGARVASKMASIEGKVVQDADRLDALGAIGIARCFAYGGHKGREIYNPTIKPESHATFEAYKNASPPSLNHFYEKLLLIKDRMNTTAGKKVAEHRHLFMEQYLAEFYAEWDGKR